MSTTTAGSTDLDPDAKLRCSDFSRAVGLSPVGTAGSYDGYLLVEIPLPWPRDVGETPEGVALGPLLGPLRYRLQAVVPADATAAPHERRVVLYARHPGEAGFSGYRRFASPVGESLTETVGVLIAAAADEAPSPLEAPGVDVLVCGHGTRDSCCGRRGAGLVATLAAGGRLDGVNLRRTSHLGGHRFAPTFLVLPEGTVWGFGDAEVVEAVVHRTGDAADLAAYYRGCSGLPGPQLQAMEREVLRRVGWDLLDTPRTGSFDGTTARLSCGDGAAAVVWTGDVRAGRTLPMPGCREAASETSKRETEWAVTAVRRCGDTPPEPGERA